MGSDGFLRNNIISHKSVLRGYVERMIDEKLASSNPAYPKHDQEALTTRENIWRAHGMSEETKAFAAVLYRNNELTWPSRGLFHGQA